MSSIDRRIVRAADIVIIALVCFSGFILVYSLVNRMYATNVLYSVVPAVFTALFAFSLKFGEPYRVNFALMAVVLGLFVYAAEIIVGYVELYRHYDSFIRRKYEKLDLLEEMRARGTRVYPIFSSSDLLGRKRTLAGRVPLGGISRATTILGNESGTWILYESDEYGFNNPRGIWGADSVDVVTVGDSFVHGLVVEPGLDIASHIRKRYPLTLNIGYAGNGPLRELASLVEYAAKVHPRFVVWFYYENDLVDLRHAAAASLFGRYLEDGFTQRLMEAQAFIDSALSHVVDESIDRELEKRRRGGGVRAEVVRTVLKNRSLFSIVALKALRKRVRFLFPESAELTGELSLFHEVLVAADRRVRAWGGEMLFVYLPGKYTYAGPKRVNANRGCVLDLVGSIGIPVIDIHGVFSAQRDPLALFPEREIVHYNARGYELVADTVLAYIRSRSAGSGSFSPAEGF
jgi:hypothetical protein